MCGVDDPAPLATTPPSSLWVTVASATFYFDAGNPVTVPASGLPFDLFACLAAGTTAIPAFSVPAPPPGAEGAKVLAVRMHLSDTAPAQVPDGQGGAWTVLPKSGPEDTGLDIELQFGAPGTSLAPGSLVHAQAQNVSSANDWQAMFECSAGVRTVSPRFKVTNPCEASSCAP